MTMLLLAICLASGIGIQAEAKNENEENVLNYLVVEKPYMENEETQNVVVSIGNSDWDIEEAQLHYVDKNTKEKFQQKATRKQGNALLFQIQFDEDTQTVYELEKITFTVEGKSNTLSLKEENAIFGVGVEVDVQADAYIVEETQPEVNVVTIDDKGQQSSVYSIAEALENVMGQAGEKNQLRYGSTQGFVVVLDPGHGGTDPGATRTYDGITYYERDINLKIAEYCKEELDKHPGVTVYMTRTDNTSKLMSRKERTEYAMSVGADVIVSLHINSTSAQSTTASGALVYVPKKDTDSGKISQELGLAILKELEELGLKNRGNMVDESLGMVLYPKQEGVPGILIEHAFINNASDVSNFLSTDEKLKQLGIADAKGILTYFEEAIRNKMINVTSDYESTQVTWPDMEFADGYQVWRSEDAGRTWNYIDTVWSKTVYEDRNVEAGKYYFYKIHPFELNEEGPATYHSGIISKGVAIEIEKPVMTNVVAQNGKIQVSWEAVEGASGYQVWRTTDYGKSWKYVGTSGTTHWSEATEGLESHCIYSIYAYRYSLNNTVAWSLPSTEYLGCVPIETPVLTQVLSEGADIRINWNPVADASGYQIWRTDNRGLTWSYVDTAWMPTYLDIRTTEGEYYQYSIYAFRYKGNGEAIWSLPSTEYLGIWR